MQSAHNRRSFLRTSAFGVTAGFFSSRVCAEKTTSPNEKLNIAVVGCGNKGRHNVDQLKSENFVAFCDVDTKFLNKAMHDYKGATEYRDFRRMFDKEQNRIDAVVVSTADHTHAPATSIALDLGKHAYCEKPLAHTVAEARTLATLAKKNGLATQMGTQIHAGENYRRVVELIQGGAIGKVREVHNWCNKGWSDGRFQSWEKPVPANLDWDLWLGPASKRDYSPNVHPADWRRFWEYGTGTFGDMACHVMDLPFWALGLRHPVSVECEGPPVHPVGAPNWVKATYEFAESESHGPLKFTWSDGGHHFDIVKNTTDRGGQPLSKRGLGILFVGDKGKLVSDYGRHQLLPAESFEDFQPPAQSIDPSVGHWNEWIAACKTGSPTTCNFDYSGALSETVLLGTVAYRTGEKLNWDAEKLQATNCDEAAQFVSKQYREGWRVVGLS